MSKFPERLKLPKPAQEGIDNLNRPRTSKEIELVILKLSPKTTKKTPTKY